MPTLAELRDGVYRDLADEAEPHVFSTLQVEDFIRGGIADLNRVAPVDQAYDLPLVSDPDTNVVTQFAYPIPIDLAYRVEIVRSVDDAQVIDLTRPVDGWVGSGGFDFKKTPDGGLITFPAWFFVDFDPLAYTIRVHGYGPRELPISVDETTTPSPEVAIGSQEEYSVRTYAKSAGYDMLAHDRSLFAQWQGQSNNTDVSPTQMMQMSENSKREWDRHRGLIRVVRLYW